MLGDSRTGMATTPLALWLKHPFSHHIAGETEAKAGPYASPREPQPHPTALFAL